MTAAENRIAQVDCTGIAIIATCDGNRDAVITAHGIVGAGLRSARKKELKVDRASGDIGCGQRIREVYQVFSQHPAALNNWPDYLRGKVSWRYVPAIDAINEHTSG
jgi:hypothetical protein